MKGHTELVTILKDHAKTREPLAEDSGDRIAPEPEPELVAGTTETEIKRVVRIQIPPFPRCLPRS